MEQQSTDSSTPTLRPTREPKDHSLRFPKPEGSQELANWVSNSSPDIKKSPIMSSDQSSILAESAYEMINSTDGDSQDDQISESVGSLEYPQTGDVHSLSGSASEQRTDSGDEDDEQDHHSSASSIRYADQVLQNPSSHMPSSSLQFRPTPEASILPQSIEFFEAETDRDGHVHAESMSVMHTIREFDEQETAAIAKNLELGVPPKRLVGTLRQTMSQACLSTGTPLRVLYTGSDAARKDIVYKLSEAISTSGACTESGMAGQRNNAVYNIVPISAFGSAKVPEIELMESSEYQIRVEHCTKAEETSVDGGYVYSVTIDQDKTYKSLLSRSGSIIQPKWTLPHVAIFFCTENDDEQAETTRDVAWEFMSRHGVPSIFISHEQSFTKSASGRWRDFVDQHAVHLCLESRDPDIPILSQRLPIDLASFLNIDARQMNRNLAYLTGLSDPGEDSQSEIEVVSSKCVTLVEETQDQDEKKPLAPEGDMKQWAVEFYQRHRQQLWRYLIVALTSLFLHQVLQLVLQSSGLLPRERSAVMTTAVSSVAPTSPSARSASTTTTTVIINVTSTKTVNLQRAEASASPLASALSFAGLLSDRTSTATTAEPEATKSVCSIERYGKNKNEILVRIPTSKKSAWLARGAIDIDVSRGEQSLKAKLSSVDEGIVIELNKKDAYGVLNVSVITTRKPKINETFEVNLGNNAVVEAYEAAAQVVLGLRDKAVHSGEQALHSGVDAVHSAVDSIAKVAHTVDHGVREAGQAAQGLARRAVGGALDSLHPGHVVKSVEAARQEVADRIASAKADTELTVLKLQIASKLWSLKVQGKTAEHAKYEQKAADFLKKRHDELKRMLKSRDDAAQQKEECGCTGGKRKARRCSKMCATARKAIPKAGARWKRLVAG